MNLNNLRLLYMEDNDHDMAKKLVDISSKLASAFEMGRYHEVSAGLDVAVWEKDEVQTLRIVQEILESTRTIRDFISSSLYQHMQLKAIPDDYTEHLLEKELLGIFEDDSWLVLLLLMGNKTRRI